MKNAEAIRRRIDEVKEMTDDDQAKALSMLAEISYDIGIDACDERAALKREVDKLRQFIIGNGDPANSIMSRLRGVEESINELMCDLGKDVKDIKEALLGDMKGDKKGIKDRVADNTRITQNLNRIVWAVVLIVVGELVARLIGLL